MITVIGLGFVGLTTALGFSSKGFKTYGIELNKDIIKKLNNLIIPFNEPFLNEKLKNLLNKEFFINASIEEAIDNSKVIFLCVGTPQNEDGSANLNQIIAAITILLKIINDSEITIVIKSTVPPSTVESKIIPFIESKISSKQKINIAVNPEFLREGKCWVDFQNPDRIVIGLTDEKSKELLSEIYKPFNAPMHFTSPSTAEFIKYLSNTYLSTMISFSNELAMIGESIPGVDIPKAFKIFHEDRRWSGSPANMSSYAYPGAGYGGYCLPKDTKALISVATEHGIDPVILKANTKTNSKIIDFHLKNITKEISIDSPIGILGLSFKPDSDDVRNSPSFELISKLRKYGFRKIYAYDPISINVFKNAYPNLDINYFHTFTELIASVDNIIISTAWNEFYRDITVYNNKKVFDLRYMLDE